MKPDLTAPGKYILSAGALPDSVGECDPSKVPSGFQSGSDGVKWNAGTSMATPVVSGNAALIRQYFEEGFYPSGVKSKEVRESLLAIFKRHLITVGRYNRPDHHYVTPRCQNVVASPSAALIKAVLLNGAQFLDGVDNLAKGAGITDVKPYDNNQGFGRLSMQSEMCCHEHRSAAFQWYR